MSKSFSSKILSLDHPLSALANATLCITIMAITNSAGKKLFLLVNHNWNGQGFIFAYPMLYASQASDYVEYLPVYLAHSHSDKVFHWFSLDAVAEAQAMGMKKRNNPSLRMGWIFAPRSNPWIWNGALPPFLLSPSHDCSQYGQYNAAIIQYCPQTCYHSTGYTIGHSQLDPDIRPVYAGGASG